MAKGLQKHQERIDALNLLGKNLARRASSKCELCEAAGVSLKTYEVAPVPAEPDIDHCLMICETCQEQLGHLDSKQNDKFGKAPKEMQAEHWRCLGKTIWSTLPAAQVVSLRVLRQLENDYPWVGEILEHAYLDAEVEAWAENT